MNIRLLNDEDLIPLYRTFTSAFAKNEVRFEPSLEEFNYRIHKKLLLDRVISAAALDGDEMVGFILHSSNLYQGIPTAYNGGTGVLPGFRNQNVAAQIYDYLIPRVQQKSLARILLEVVETNIYAIALYEKIGFTFKRRFKCYKKIKDLDATLEVDVEEGDMKDVDFSFIDFHPCFLDSEEHLKRGNEKVLITRNAEGSLTGYLIMQPHLGRISQIAVDRLHRQSRIGLSLIRKAQTLTDKPLTIMNIPEDEIGFDVFLKGCGFENQVNQFEMELII
ncbi:MULTISPECIES: GNAT family N-acetyltransferase [unclassified Ekhidna]|jgi:ribosomal protein S18 acetylase RimI-like enzyme|uniref:GNAT family N-acetyltransferase n=1 Tax=unclassified Ekhidna TaxID=2632188 RepID=UPI0032DEB5C9